MLSDLQIQRLVDLAGVATQEGLVDKARIILDGVLALRDEHIPALIIQAFTHIVVDDFQGAQDILDNKVLSKNPDDADALAMKGLAFMLAGQKDEAREVLARIPEDASTSELAKNLLQEIG